MGQFEKTLLDTLVFITRLGISVVILFLIGYILRLRHLKS